MAAVDLDAVLGGAHGDLAREQFRHRRLASGPATMILQIGRAVHQQAGGLDSRRHIREFPLDGLERRDRLAELPTLSDIGASDFVRTLGEAHGERGDANAARVANLQRVDQALALFAQQLIGLHLTVLKDHLCGIARPHP